MSNRRVTCSGKDSDGDITHLGNKPVWGTVPKASAIAHIEDGDHRYYVQDSNGSSDVQVVNGPSGKYLRSDPNGSCSDNLDNLADC